MKWKIVVILAVMALAVAGCTKKEESQKTETPQAAAPAQQQQQPPVAGTEIVAVDVTLVAKGWSARNQLLGKDVYNDKHEKVGMVQDLIVAPDKAVSYVIIAAGGFLGMDKHDVAIPANQLKMEAGKIVLPGATRDAIKAMPPFNYGS